jgi:hypothetical protein
MMPRFLRLSPGSSPVTLPRIALIRGFLQFLMLYEHLAALVYVLDMQGITPTS